MTDQRIELRALPLPSVLALLGACACACAVAEPPAPNAANPPHVEALARAATPESVGFSSERLGLLDRWLEGEIAQGRKALLMTQFAPRDVRFDDQFQVLVYEALIKRAATAASVQPRPR